MCSIDCKLVCALEAILYDCPMAVSKIYAMPEQLKNASLYFNPKSIYEISNAICILWSNKTHKLKIYY